MNRQWAVLIVVAGLVVGPSRSFAQSATTGTIAGVVRDATGAVLPGVTVEAASPALIEKARSVVTDAGGQYKIIDLRPGLYSVTFTLPGFGTYKRDALDLSAGFTATVNAELKVGALEETVTVTGASPVVDIQNTRSQSVLRSEVLDALPAGTKSMAGLASLTLGAIPSRPGVNDVGGDKGEQSATIIMHGGRLDDSRVNYDGMNTNVFFANGGGRTYYFNTVAVQEVVIDTGGSSAETETGGASVNMVPKEGGNGLKLYATASYTDSRFAAKAISDDLAARGVGPQSSVKSIYDHGFSLGGPISRDRLWVLGTSRWWGAQQFGANNFYNKSTNPYTYVPDASRRAYADNYFVDSSLRLTWQATGKHKFSQAGHLQHGCSCQLAIGSGANVAPEAATDFDYGPQVLSQTSWSYPATNKLLFQAGAQFLNQNVSFVNGVLSNSSKLTGSGEPVWPGPSNFSILELSTGYTYGAMAGSVTNYGEKDDSSNFNQRFSVSYVTGSHAFKTGLQTLQGRYDINGMQVPNQVTYQFRAGAPVSLIQWAGPFVSRMRLSGVALYAQDQWTVKKVTLNVGVRFDRFEGHTLPIDLPAGPFIAARPVGALEGLPDYKDVTPRVGVAYDLFGTGRTALKGSFGKYLYGQAGGLSLLYAPSLAIVQSVSRTWNDVNGNFAPDCVLTESATNGECGPISNRAFGQPITNSTIAADAVQGWGRRTYNYQTSIQLQHELAPGVGLFAGYFRTWWGNLTVTQNTLVSPSDFTPYCITSPTDARLADYSGKSICGFYDVNPDKFGQVNRVTTRASHFGEPAEVYNGFDVGFNARWGQGALLSGGVGVGRQSVDYCYANGRPDLTPENFPANYPRSAEYCKVTSSWWNGIGSQVKLQAIYPLPMGFVVSGTFKNMPGLAQQANLVLGNAQVAGSLGRSLSACPATGTCTATVTAALLRQGSNSSFPVAATLYDERINQIDMRLTKGVRIGRGRVQGMLDVYNLLNDRPPQSLNATYGAAWLRPLTILGGRLLKFGAQLDF